MKKIDYEKTSIENDDNILTNVKTETEIKEVKQMSKDDYCLLWRNIKDNKKRQE
jgi:hypothetical protein